MLSNKNANLIFFFQMLFLFFTCFDTRLLFHSLSFLLWKCLHCTESWGTAKLWPSAAIGFIHSIQLYLSCSTIFQEDKSLLEGAKSVTPVQNYLLHSALHTNSKKVGQMCKHGLMKTVCIFCNGGIFLEDFLLFLLLKMQCVHLKVALGHCNNFFTAVNYCLDY